MIVSKYRWVHDDVIKVRVLCFTHPPPPRNLWNMNIVFAMFLVEHHTTCTSFLASILSMDKPGNLLLRASIKER